MRRYVSFVGAALLALGLGAPFVFAQVGGRQSKLVHEGRDGKLAYASDKNGNTIIDFSNCGYRGGGVKLPEAPVRITLQPVRGEQDAGPRIQEAINQLAKATPNKDGIRGAIRYTPFFSRIAPRIPSLFGVAFAS